MLPPRRQQTLAPGVEAEPAEPPERDDPASGASAEESTAEDAPGRGTSAATDPRHVRRVRVLVTLGVAAVLLVAASIVLAVGAYAAANSGERANEAFVDGPATAELVGQVTSAIKTVYTYDYRALPANETEAKSVITGKFADEFGKVFEPVKQLAPQQQAVLTTSVPAVGVTLLQGERARLLMMVDQRGVRGQGQQLAGSTARLVVDAQRVDGRWKIAEVTP